MSAAERQRRRRDRLRAAQPAKADAKPGDEVAKLKAEIRRLKTDAARRAPSAQARPAGADADARMRQLKTAHSRREEIGEFTEIGRLRGEIGRLKSDNRKLKEMLQEEPDAAKLRKKVADQQVEMAAMRREMKEIAKERDQYEKRARRLTPKYQEAAKLLTVKNHNIIVKALHYDRSQQCTADELKNAERVAVALRPLFTEED
jgi:hypothetical protein